MAKVRADQRSHRARGKAGYRTKGGGGREKGGVGPPGKGERAERAAKLAIAFLGTDLEEAINVASEVAVQADWLCLGPPLIKSEGVRAIRAFSVGFPEREIFADLKASIGAGIESAMAFEAGADLISVSVTASDKSCREAVGVAKTFGGKSVFDLYGAGGPLAAANRAIEFGFDYLYLGVEGGVARGYEVYRQVADVAELPLIVDGEIEFREFARISRLLPAVIVVGGQITKAEDPASAAARFGGLIHRRRAA